MTDWLNIYQSMPHSVRTIMASLHGYYLHFWRYGKNTEQLITEAFEREQWSHETWEAWQKEKVVCVLRHAAKNVPYYRKYWEERRQKGEKVSIESLRDWPILRKEDLRKNPKAFLSDDCNIRKMFCTYTSGTTGTSLPIYSSRETLRKWYAMYEARNRRWNRVSIKERWGIMGGKLVVPYHKETPPFWVYNAGLNQLYLSTHHISPQNARYYVEALRSYHPSHLVVYPSSAYILASAVLDQGLTPPEMKVIISNAELLLDVHREKLVRAFQCPVRNTYSMVESAAGGSECHKGSMHIWPEAGHIEILDDNENVPAKNEVTGRIISTGLFNTDMPLIRYETGDRGKLADRNSECPCGRKLPVMETIEGRLNDLILTPDGRQIFWLNPVFYGLPVLEAQIIQHSLEQIHVNLVPAYGYSNETATEIVKRLHDRVGQMKIELKETESIPRSANGKFKFVISRISQ